MMKREAFERLVARALDSLPDNFLRHMENVDVLIEKWPTREDLEEAGLEGEDRRELLGLYYGVPLTERTMDYAGYLPDRITLFQGPIELAAGGDPHEIQAEVQDTVIHEVAHYFGISDERLKEMGWG